MIQVKIKVEVKVFLRSWSSTLSGHFDFDFDFDFDNFIGNKKKSPASGGVWMQETNTYLRKLHDVKVSVEYYKFWVDVVVDNN